MVFDGMGYGGLGDVLSLTTRMAFIQGNVGYVGGGIMSGRLDELCPSTRMAAVQ